MRTETEPKTAVLFCKPTDSKIVETVTTLIPTVKFYTI